MRPSISIIGGIGELGGALAETWDTLQLLRSHGLAIHVAVANPPVPAVWQQRLSDHGYRISAGVDDAFLNAVSGATVVGICSEEFLKLATRLIQQRCRLIWVNCMTWVFPREREIYPKQGTFDAYMFQGEFQRAELERELVEFGYDPAQGHLIRGYIHLPDWPFQPTVRQREDEFVVGRLARPDLSKWSRATWKTYGKIDHPRRRGLVMGVDDMVRKWIGRTPEWGEALPPCAISSHDFYRRVHCLLPINFSALESWPRVGLEAMATGVPIVAPRQGGWVDMIRHGENGFLADSADELAAYATQLANDEDLRQRIIRQAREMLESELANPDQIWEGWRKLLQLA